MTEYSTHDSKNAINSRKKIDDYGRTRSNPHLTLDPELFSLLLCIGEISSVGNSLCQCYEYSFPRSDIALQGVRYRF